MPKTTKGGNPKADELPSTLQRSNAKAQRTFAKAHDAAADEYGSRRAPRCVLGAQTQLRKSRRPLAAQEKKGPSDARAERGGLHNPIPSAEGVDADAARSTCSTLPAGSNTGSVHDEQVAVGRCHQEAQPSSPGSLTTSTRLRSNRFEISTAKGSAITIPIGKTRYLQSGGGVQSGN